MTRSMQRSTVTVVVSRYIGFTVKDGSISCDACSLVLGRITWVGMHLKQKWGRGFGRWNIISWEQVFGLG